jgi:hypothetical protein
VPDNFTDDDSSDSHSIDSHSIDSHSTDSHFTYSDSPSTAVSKIAVVKTVFHAFLVGDWSTKCIMFPGVSREPAAACRG